MASSVIKRYGTAIGQPEAAIIRTIQWNGTNDPPADFHAVPALVTNFATLYIEVQDKHGVPVPNAVVEITFANTAAITTENAGSIPSGYGTPITTSAVATYFAGIVGVSSGDSAALTAQTSITHMVTANAYGVVVLKFASNPSTVAASAIAVKSGSAQVRITDLTGLTTNP